jgi:hypothetical protein
LALFDAWACLSAAAASATFKVFIVISDCMTTSVSASVLRRL